MIRNDRDSTIDILKGIGILLMVYRHARGPLSIYIILFHMALFFIASGYLYNGNKINSVESLVNFIKRKIKNLWCPYFEFTVFYILMNNIFIKCNIYTNNPQILNTASEYLTLANQYSLKITIKEIIKAVFFQANTQIGGALWFFGTLFGVIVLYASLDYVLKRLYKNVDILQGIISVIFLIIGYLCGKQEIYCYGLARIMSVYIFIFIGMVIKKYNLMQILEKKSNKIIIGGISCIAILMGKSAGTISVVGNKFSNPVFFLVMSLAGWNVIWIVSRAVAKKKNITSEVLAYISQHSVCIIGLHFLCFKLVSLIIISVYKYPIYRLAEFPVLVKGGGWALLYTSIGILVSLLVEKILFMLKNFLKKKSIGCQ